MRNDDPSQSKQDPPYIDPALIIDTRLAELERQQHKDKEEQKNNARHQRWTNWLLAIFSGLLVVANVTSNLLMLRQTNAAVTSASAAVQAADIAQRTFLSSTLFLRRQIRPYVIVESSRVNHRPQAGLMLAVETVLRNTGATPALRMRVAHRFDLQDKLPCTVAANIPISEGIIDVGTNLTRSVRVFGQRPLTQAEADRINKGRIFACYSITLVYEDVFKEQHATKACSYYKPPLAGAEVGEGDLYLYTCPQEEYNRMD